jgi:hypothetical protein
MPQQLNLTLCPPLWQFLQLLQQPAEHSLRLQQHSLRLQQRFLHMQLPLLKKFLKLMSSPLQQ